jgi:hypothetical protein
MKSPFRLNKTTMAVIGLFLGLFLLAAATDCSAENPEPVLTAEAGVTVLRAPTAGVRLSVEWPEAGPKDASFQCGLTVIGPYELKGANANQAIFDCLVTDSLWKFDLGIGPAYLQNRDEINGSHFNFALMARFRVTDQLAVVWRHWSNAGTKPPNLGRDLVTLAYSF